MASLANRRMPTTSPAPDIDPRAPVLVMGAGAIGCCLGGCLRAAGAPVVFVGRPRVLAALREHGLRLTDLDGGEKRLAAAALSLHEVIPAGLAPAFVLLALKSGATAEALNARMVELVTA